MEWNWFDTLPGDVQDEWNTMQQIVRAVAKGNTDASGRTAEGGPWSAFCSFCHHKVGGENTHASDCPVVKARALVKQWEQES